MRQLINLRVPLTEIAKTFQEYLAEIGITPQYQWIYSGSCWVKICTHFAFRASPGSKEILLMKYQMSMNNWICIDTLDTSEKLVDAANKWCATKHKF